MHSLQRKLLFYIVIIGVIPVILFAFFYYDSESKRVTDKLYSESCGALKQLDNKLVVKISRIQNTMDIILDDEDFFRQMSEATDEPDGNGETVQKSLDEIYGKFARSERSLKGLIFFGVDGNSYVAGNPAEDVDPVRFIMPYYSIGSDSGTLSWLGLKEPIPEQSSNVIVAGTMLRDGCYKKDQSYVGNMYMVFDDDMFMGEEEKLSEIDENIQTQNLVDQTLSVYDAKAKLIYSRGARELRNVFLERPISDGAEGYGDDAGSFKIKESGDEYLVIYYTSPITGWKFVRPVACERYYEELTYIKYMVVLAFVLLFAVWYIINYFLVNRIMLPIRELTEAMQNVEKDNFETELKVRSKDEIGVISVGFNTMVAHIKNLLVRIRSEEKKRRQLDIMMLRYQMNPHFLYNTLAAIRFTAIMNKQNKIAEMLLILGRFLRNAILTVDSTLDVKSEIANIEDYIALYQLRYNDRLQVSITADESCYDYRILSMICQPIIENSIMHGLDEKLNSEENAILKIHITEEDEILCISIYDNGCGIEEDKIKQLLRDSEDEDNSSKDRLQIGVLNTHKRIRLIYGEEYGLEIKSEVGKYTDVKIKLPKKKNK